jgi:hypothetical protein
MCETHLQLATTYASAHIHAYYAAALIMCLTNQNNSISEPQLISDWLPSLHDVITLVLKC